MPCLGDPPAAGRVVASLCLKRERNQIGMFGKYRHGQGGCQGPTTLQSTRTVWAEHTQKLEENGEPSSTGRSSCPALGPVAPSAPVLLTRCCVGKAWLEARGGCSRQGVGRISLVQGRISTSVLAVGRQEVGRHGKGTRHLSQVAHSTSLLTALLCWPWAHGHGCVSSVRSTVRALCHTRHCACCPAHRAEPKLGFRGCSRKAEIRESRAGHACPFRAELSPLCVPAGQITVLSPR